MTSARPAGPTAVPGEQVACEMFIAGEWTPAATGETFTASSPATGAVIGSVAQGDRTDAQRAIEAARAHPAVDGDRIAVAGSSQGGALSLAVAALRDDVIAALPEVPFLCDMRRATQLTDTEPYQEIARYLKVHRDQVETAFRTLSFVDLALLASRATAPALFSVGLLDTICPPSTVYAAYNAYGGPKQIIEYAYNDHEGGGEFHEVAKVSWLRSLLDGDATERD